MSNSYRVNWIKLTKFDYSVKREKYKGTPNSCPEPGMWQPLYTSFPPLIPQSESLPPTIAPIAKGREPSEAPETCPLTESLQQVEGSGFLSGLPDSRS